MSKHYYAYISRMKNIFRWGLMKNNRQENLSEHSLEVAIVAHALAVIGNTRLNKNYNENYIAVCALFHDTSETITGDMPTPIKYYNPEIKNVYKEIEGIAEEKLLDMLPDDLKEEYRKYYNPDLNSKLLIKAADKISAYIKCIEETETGNKEFIEALASTEKAIHNMNVAEAEIFLKDFIPSFSLPLDSQN